MFKATYVFPAGRPIMKGRWTARLPKKTDRQMDEQTGGQTMAKMLFLHVNPFFYNMLPSFFVFLYLQRTSQRDSNINVRTVTTSTTTVLRNSLVQGCHRICVLFGQDQSKAALIIHNCTQWLWKQLVLHSLSSKNWLLEGALLETHLLLTVQVKNVQ